MIKIDISGLRKKNFFLYVYLLSVEGFNVCLFFQDVEFFPIFGKKANISSKLFIELFRGSVAKVTEVACPAVAGTTFHSSTTVVL